MSGFLLDTNVVSEIAKTEADPRVIAFLTSQNDLWLSTIVLHELAVGLNLLPEGHLRDRVSTALSGIVAEYEDRILPIARREAEWAARLRAHADRAGRVLHLGDALIAGTARAQDLCVATRNVVDFDGLDVEVTNPWETH